MRDEICLITGASSGIGRATALGVARLGALVILVCRDVGRGQAAVEDIRIRSGGGRVELMIADLGSQPSIRKLVTEFAAKYERLDVLINNAGLFLLRRDRSVTAEGLEVHFAVNHLGHFLLTNLLLGHLKAAAKGRVVTVASHLHEKGTIDFNDLQMEKYFRGLRAYANSKLANVLFTYELARKLAGTSVTVNCLHPGIIATGLVLNNIPAPIRWLGNSMLAGPEKGAATSIYLASSPEVEGVSGKYFVKRREHRSSPESYDAAAASRLWDVSRQLTGLAPNH